ncbi:site-specific tyrosine recombinase XerC [Dyella humi]|uniref:Site-specific tyrosine recombinase XerC n=1 Tax=Dyella humi TaxID=1770547 RepID=A0ABW8IF94_9GAMM
MSRRRATPVTPVNDPLASHPLTRYMNAHFEAMLVRGYSPDTVYARRIVMRRFIAWCAERHLDDPRAITKPMLERYQKSLFYYRKPNGEPLSLGSQMGCLAPLKTFFKWMARENHILYNPASELELPRQPKRLPRALLSVEDIEAILREAMPDTASGLRDRAMLELVYSTGLRRMEVTRLAIYDVDLSRRLVLVREGKGKKDRMVPLGERAAAWVIKYLAEARPALLVADNTSLFITDLGETILPENLASKVKRYMQRAGIHKVGAVHLFRHACATHMLDNGADVRYIQALLGHANLETTEIYTHVSIEKLQQIHAATHPAKLTRTARPASDDDEPHR